MGQVGGGLGRQALPLVAVRQSNHATRVPKALNPHQRHAGPHHHHKQQQQHQPQRRAPGGMEASGGCADPQAAASLALTSPPPRYTWLLHSSSFVSASSCSRWAAAAASAERAPCRKACSAACDRIAVFASVIRPAAAGRGAGSQRVGTAGMLPCAPHCY